MKLSGKEINDNLDEHKSQFKTDADTYKEMFETYVHLNYH